MLFDLIEPKIQCEEISPDKKYGRFVVEPLEEVWRHFRQFFLRRVLLSSLPGSEVLPGLG